MSLSVIQLIRNTQKQGIKTPYADTAILYITVGLNEAYYCTFTRKDDKLMDKHDGTTVCHTFEDRRRLVRLKRLAHVK